MKIDKFYLINIEENTYGEVTINFSGSLHIPKDKVKALFKQSLEYKNLKEKLLNKITSRFIKWNNREE